MQLTKERPLVRWAGLVAAWLVLAVGVCIHSTDFERYIALLDGLALRGESAPTTPLKRICPTMYADTQMWVRHSLALADGAGPQLRETQVDNAPAGREVHWDSGFAWLLAGAGALQRLFTGEPFPAAVEHSLAWFNAVLVLGMAVVFSAAAARWAGLGAGLLLGFAMVGNQAFFVAFYPNYVDHHGFLALATLGLFLGGVRMGGGFRRDSGDLTQLLPATEGDMRRGAIFSAVAGAIGMWVSAATTLPAIVLMGAAGMLAILSFRPGSTTGAQVSLEPGVWRLWGRWGGGLSLGFYLLEYAPSHFGFRLEVNHPLYALAWWAGGELIATVADWKLRGLAALRGRATRVSLAVIGVLIAPVVILCFGSAVFVVFDPFISRMAGYVAESVSVPKTVAVFGWGRVIWHLVWASVTLLAAVVAFVRGRREDRPLLVFLAGAFIGFVGLAFSQMRWWPSVSGVEICLLIVALSSLGGRHSAGVRWAGVAVVVLGLCVPPVVHRCWLQRYAVVHRSVDPTDVVQPLYRDIAATLEKSAGGGDVVLLSSPNASTSIGYYGQFKTVGTLYWENLSGIKAAAGMFSATTETEAHRLIRARGVTHVAMVSTENFLREYLALLRPDAPEGTFEQTFGYRLLVLQNIPLWMDLIPFSPTPDLPGARERVVLLKTRFGDPRAEDLYEEALTAIEAGNRSDAETKLDAALAIEPTSPSFQLIKSRLRLLAGDVTGAERAVSVAIDNAQEDRRPALCISEGGRFYVAHAHAQALALFRRASALQPTPTLSKTIAWIQATSSDDRLRDGPAALQAIEPIVSANATFDNLSTYAAALAACDRFADAVTVATKVVEIARSANASDLVSLSERRLAEYRQGRAWRE